MRSIQTEIIINAPLARVWSVLTDFAQYPQWNPFIREIAGEPREGGALRVTLGPPDGKTMTFKPRVTIFRPEQEFAWLGTLGFAWVFGGEHFFRLSATPDGSTRFVQGEKFGGALMPLLWKNLDSDTKGGFEAMNQAIKQRAEAD